MTRGVFNRSQASLYAASTDSPCLIHNLGKRSPTNPPICPHPINNAGRNAKVFSISSTTSLPVTKHNTAECNLPCFPALQFLPFINKQSSFAALIDSGAQLNLVNHSLLPFLDFKPVSQFSTPVRGLFGRTDAAQWIKFPVVLNSDITIQIEAAVITDLPCLVIFGLPFLHQVKANHHVPDGYLLTRYGPLALVTAPTKAPMAEVLVIADDKTSDVDLGCSSLTQSEKEEVLTLLREFQDLWREGRRGQALEVSHKIRLTHNRPIVCRPRPVTEEQKKIINEEIEKMLRDQVIRPSKSPHVSEIVLVKKKTGDWRMCIDFRGINKATVPDKYPLPRISDLVHAVKGSKYFAALDLRAGYWQVPMETDSIKYTAFRCFKGLFEFLVMPFGLSNAPATFQRLVDTIFGDLRFSGVLAYLDDILIHSTTFQNTLRLLRTVFIRLRTNGLTVNLPKSVFFPKRLKYLGQIIEDGFLLPDPKKIDAIGKIKPPATLSEVRSLLGFLGHYQTFIPCYADIMTPVYDLLRNHKNKKHYNATTPTEWDSNCQQAVDTAIKKLAVSTLAVPLDSDEFQIETDASGKAVAAILSVKRDNKVLPVEYKSSTLSRTQQNWPAREREAYAIVYALQQFDHYVRGRQTRVITDHESLKWMLDCPKGKIARWASTLAEYPITIYHKKGKELLHVDFLSRFLDDEPDPLGDRMCYITAATTIPTLDEILAAQHNQPSPSGKGFITKEGTTYYHGLIYVPPAFRHPVIRACHSTSPFNHPGVKKTKRIIARSFNWPGLHQDVVRHLRSCIKCRMARSGQERLQGLRRIHPTPGVFETIYIDFWDCNYRETEHYTVLTFIDQTTKWAECSIIHDKAATTVATALLNTWIYRFGVPRVIMSDQDKSFNNALLVNLYAKLGIVKLTSTPYHPEGNATIESFHRTLSTGLRFIQQNLIPFPEALHLVLYAYRSTPHSTTNQSPGYLTYGVDLRPPQDQDWRLEPEPLTAERLKFLTTLRLEIQLKAQQLVAYNNSRNNESRKFCQFEEGQLVLCRAQPIDALKYKTAYYKAVPRWTLPYRVIKVLAHQTTAIVRCIISGSQRQVHIQDVQFMLPPVDESQRKEWREVMETEILTFRDPQYAQRMIDDFFTKLDHPQLQQEEEMSSRVKRLRGS